MPTTIWKREEFSLATLEGHDCGLCHVAIQITYDLANGHWDFDGVGFVYHSEIERVVNGRVTWRDSIAWFQERDDLALEQRILARARSKYRDEIDEFVWQQVQQDREDYYEAAE